LQKSCSGITANGKIHITVMPFTNRIQPETLPPNNSWIQEQKHNIETQGGEQEEEKEAGKETNGIAARGRRHNKGKEELSEAFFTK
jgi:hypothetical protein